MSRNLTAAGQWLRRHGKVFLWVEFCLVFIGVPTLCYLQVLRLSPMKTIWAASAFCVIVLLRDRKFEFRRLWQVSRWREHVPRAAFRFAAVASILSFCSFFHLRDPGAFSHVSGYSPLAFALFFYPLLSVYPQGIIYRGFLFHRYQSLFPDRRLLILASAVVFGYGHIIYNEPATVGLTMAGGLFFAGTYAATGSLILAGIEHALYGDFIFAAGLWKYFFHLHY